MKTEDHEILFILSIDKIRKTKVGDDQGLLH